MSADPIGQLGGINVYGYALNDPLNDFDRFGLNNFGGPINASNLPRSRSYLEIYREAFDTADGLYPRIPGSPGRETQQENDFRHCCAS